MKFAPKHRIIRPMNQLVEEKLKLLPDHPGVYRMFNAEGEIIYVGKAVNLKNRVRQYFHSQKNMITFCSRMISISPMSALMKGRIFPGSRSCAVQRMTVRATLARISAP